MNPHPPPDSAAITCAPSTSAIPSAAWPEATAARLLMSWPVSQRSWSNSCTPMSIAIPPLCARNAADGGCSSHW